jgi:hypothetical protein
MASPGAVSSGSHDSDSDPESGVNVNNAYWGIFNEIIEALKGTPTLADGDSLRFMRVIDISGVRDAVAERLVLDLRKKYNISASVSVSGNSLTVTVDLKNNPLWFSAGTEHYMGGRVVRRDGRWWTEIPASMDATFPDRGGGRYIHFDDGKTLLYLDSHDNIIGAHLRANQK